MLTPSSPRTRSSTSSSTSSRNGTGKFIREKFLHFQTLSSRRIPSSMILSRMPLCMLSPLLIAFSSISTHGSILLATSLCAWHITKNQQRGTMKKIGKFVTPSNLTYPQSNSYFMQNWHVSPQDLLGLWQRQVHECQDDRRRTQGAHRG